MSLKPVLYLSPFNYSSDATYPSAVNTATATASADSFARFLDYVPQEREDYIFRVFSQSKTNAFGISGMSTEFFRAAISELLTKKDEDIAFLQAVTEWLKRRLEYQHVYNAYSLDLMSDEEFDRLSHEFMVSPINLDVASIRDALEKLRRLVRFNFSNTEVAEFLSIDEKTLADAESGSHCQLSR